MENKIYIIIGAYGSGKSEYSVNYAWNTKQEGLPVSLVDLDVVNPYFRSREIRDYFEEHDIELVAPPKEYNHAHLPMLTPRIMGAVEDMDRYVILDVGGDPAGCRTLARYVPNIKKRGYEMKVVINTSRPFTSDLDGILLMLETLEYSSKLKIDEIICNTNLMEHTNQDLIKDGIELIDKAAKIRDLKFEKYLIMDKFKDSIPDGILGKKRLLMQYFLNKPWEQVHARGI